MKNLTLIVGTDSTWSIRAWLCLKIAGLKFETSVINLQKPDYKHKIEQHSTAGLVPILLGTELQVHDSLAIAEYANEITNQSLYPDDINSRARCRSLCAELHSGFNHLRANCPFTLDLPTPISIKPDMQIEIKRLETIWSSAQSNFMYKTPTVIDAFYSV